MSTRSGYTLALGLLLMVLGMLGSHSDDEPSIVLSSSQISAQSRLDAVTYALTYHGGNRNDDQYPFFGITGNKNCTNFASQVLFAGGLQPDTGAGWWMGENQAGHRLSGCGGPRHISRWLLLGGLGTYLTAKVLADPILGPRGDCGLVWSSAPHLYDYLTMTNGLSQRTATLWVEMVENQITVINGDRNAIQPGDLAFFLRNCHVHNLTSCSPYHVGTVVGFGPHTANENGEIELDFDKGPVLWFADDAGHSGSIRSIDDIAAEFSQLMVIVHIRYPGE